MGLISRSSIADAMLAKLCVTAKGTRFGRRAQGPAWRRRGRQRSGAAARLVLCWIPDLRAVSL